MDDSAGNCTRPPLYLAPGEGREYAMGGIWAVFKADGSETRDGYSVSEWWLEPHTKGPGAHTRDRDDVFYVIEGTMSFRISDRWIDARRGAFVLAPDGATHDFVSQSASRAGVLNISSPGGFESTMASIRAWFLANPPGDA